MEKVAEGVWLLKGDQRKLMSIYFLEDGDGYVMFEAGTKAMAKAARAEAERLGGLRRVVLSHAHADHRGAAPSMGVPVHCHPDEVADAETDATSPPTSTSRSCRWRGSAGPTRFCCDAGTAAG